MIGSRQRIKIVWRNELVANRIVGSLVVSLVSGVVMHLLLLGLHDARLLFLDFYSIFFEYRLVSKAEVKLSRFHFFVSLRTQINKMVMLSCL